MSQEPERQMLFDLRGKRKRVIQVIYVMLAVIMAASLLVIGLPGGVNPFGGSGAVSQDGAELAIERAERIEQRIAEQPNNANAQAELVRARVAAGNALVELDDQGRTRVTAPANEQYELAAQAWEDYLKTTGGEPDPAVAQLVAGTLFTLAQGSAVAQFQANIRDAARAQELFAEGAAEAFRKGEGPAPTGALVTLATYQYYSQQFDEAEKSRKRALASTEEDAERRQINSQLDAAKREAERIGSIIRRAERQARQDGGQSLQDPLGSLGTPDSTGGGAPQP